MLLIILVQNVLEGVIFQSVITHVKNMSILRVKNVMRNVRKKIIRNISKVFAYVDRISIILVVIVGYVPKEHHIVHTQKLVYRYAK